MSRWYNSYAGLFDAGLAASRSRLRFSRMAHFSRKEMSEGSVSCSHHKRKRHRCRPLRAAGVSMSGPGPGTSAVPWQGLSSLDRYFLGPTSSARLQRPRSSKWRRDSKTRFRIRSSPVRVGSPRKVAASATRAYSFGNRRRHACLHRSTLERCGRENGARRNYAQSDDLRCQRDARLDRSPSGSSRPIKVFGTANRPRNGNLALDRSFILPRPAVNFRSRHEQTYLCRSDRPNTRARCYECLCTVSREKDGCQLCVGRSTHYCRLRQGGCS